MTLQFSARWFGRLSLPCLALAAMAPASAMTVAEFLQRADALKAKGMMAMFSGGEIKALQGEAVTAANAYRDDVLKAKARGDSSLGCPPPKGKSRVTSDELLSSFRAIPPERRQTLPVKAGVYEFMKSRFPCK